MEGWEFASQCQGWEGRRQSRSRGWQGRKSKVRGWSLRTWSLRGSLGMVTSPARPLPAEGAQGLRIHLLSGEVTTQRGTATAREVPLGPEPQTEPRQQPQNPPTWERDAEGWLNADGRKWIQILRACVCMCVENTIRRKRKKKRKNKNCKATNPNNRRTGRIMSNIYVSIILLVISYILDSMCACACVQF